MTKKDYKLIAQAIADTWCHAECSKAIVWSLIEVLEQQNPKFNRSKFLEACGLEV